MVHFGLIGARLGHSLSPQIHQLIFKELGVEGTYDLLEIPPEELYASVHELRGKYCGVNVTIPHKINVMAALTTLSMEAQAIGAVNTIHFHNGAIRGYNTDYAGFGRLLENNGIEVQGKSAAVLGTGGASRAVLQYLIDHGVSKTREMLVDVARQLFARMGVDNTTMNDIAQASKKGRRTLYTYFKSKNEIYLAVVESELDQLYKMLQDVAAKDLPADEKLMTFLYARLDAIKALVFRNGTLKANFFRDIWRVEKIRKNFDIRETELIQGILEAGVKEGIFAMPDTEITAVVLHHALKGLEVPYIRGIMGDNISQRIKRRDNVMNLIFNGIKIK